MKKLISILIATLTVFSSISIVSAADTQMPERLSEVATQVKKQLSISNDYNTFQGQLQENGLESYWELQWKKEDGSYLTIDATESGKIMSYNYQNTVAQNKYYDHYFAPAFPKISQDKAKKSAELFLSNVLDSNTESFNFTDEKQNNLRNIDTYYFYGNIQFNKLDSPINANISVSSVDCTVTSFRRDDLYNKYIGELPDHKTSITKDQASSLLDSTLKLKLEYSTNPADSDKSDPKKAVLKYVPVHVGNYIVDAKTGELINIDALYTDINTATEAAQAFDKRAEAKSDSGLTQVELDGIDKLKGVYNKDQLDSKIRAITELGLDNFTLSDAHYSLDEQTNTVYCSLTYSLLETQQDNKIILHKNIYVNAKTAQLISVYSSFPYTEEKGSLTTQEKQKNAEAFLKKYFNSNYSKTKLYTNDDTYDIRYSIMPVQPTFTFAQNVNGYFFPENYINISIDAKSGFVNSFNMNFEDVTFDSAEGIITEKQALDRMSSTYETKLSYVAVPKKIDLSQPQWQLYAKLGYTYLYELKLTYAPYYKTQPYAIDAKSGQPLYYPNYSENIEINYTDLDNTIPEINALSKYGIGYSDSTFQPNNELTQLDLIKLLVSADGYLYKSTDELDNLYTRAYDLGILTQSERNDNKLVTRSELVKTILSMSGYGKTANLKGIYICNFTDEKDIKPEYYGFVAIAQGLGLLDRTGEFHPNTNATRKDAALMLYRFMKRVY